MKFRTSTGCILETSNPDVVSQLEKNGYEVVDEKPTKPAKEKKVKEDTTED